MDNRNPRARRSGDDACRVSASRSKWTWVGFGMGALAVGLGAYFVLVGALHRSSIRSAASTAGPAAGSNVLLITLDTTRADRLGCYGYNAAGTPTMDGLAQSGVRFEQAFCHVPLTLPSHASLMTGLCPPSTGVRINGATKLGSDVPTLADVFREHGYRTGAFIAAPVLGSAFGLGRGFDLYDEDMQDAVEADGLNVERRADSVCDAALAWLAESPGQAFFAWVHFFDPHAPYEPPADFVRRFADAYDGEIAFVDSQVRRLIEWLDGAGLRDRTMIVLVGDHGEGLSEHGEGEHGFFVYDTTMQIPLILSLPARLRMSGTVASPVRVVDVFPTIVDLLGWEVPGDLDGQSLARACRTGGVPPLPVYGESEYPWLNFGWAPLHSLTVDRWKYIDAPQAELYDRAADPGELNNVIDAHAGIVQQMRSDLLALMARMKTRSRAAEPVELDDVAIERLAGLGYVAGPSPPEYLSSAEGLRDPKEMLEVYVRFTQALQMILARDYEQAVRALEPLIRQSPESDMLHAVLGAAYLNMKRFKEAQRAFEASLRAVRETPKRLCGLAYALWKQDKLEDAIACYGEVLELAPDWEEAHRGLAGVYLQTKQFSRAEPHYRRCVDLDPTSAPDLTNLGVVLVRLSRPAEGVPLLQRALEYHPANESAHRALWQGLVALGRREEAIRSLQVARDVLPGARSITCPLAWLLATTPRRTSGEIQDAVQWAKECSEMGPGHPRGLDTLAAAYAASGDFLKAAEAARRAISMADARGRRGLQRQIEARLHLYEAGQPFVEPGRP